MLKTLFEGCHYLLGLSKSNETGQTVLSWSTYRDSHGMSFDECDGFWGNLQPEDKDGDCVAVMKDGMQNGFKYENCKERLPFVCRMEAVPLQESGKVDVDVVECKGCVLLHVSLQFICTCITLVQYGISQLTLHQCSRALADCFDCRDDIKIRGQLWSQEQPYIKF